MNALVSPNQMRLDATASRVHDRLAKARGWIEAMVADGFVFALPPDSDPTDPNDYHIRREGVDRSGDLLEAIGAAEGGRHG